MQGTCFSKFQRWSALSLLNLCLVAVLGVLLRYKIAFSLPSINYNFLLEAHFNFAFSGWISTAIFTALVYILAQSGYSVGKIYTYQFRLAQTASFGMLLSISLEGYELLSLFFSMLFILFSWWFAFQYWKDVDKSDLPVTVRRWAKAALFFFVLSGMGILTLAYLKSNRIDSPEFYFNAIYLFLHFQYNGWFSFGVISLFFHTINNLNMVGEEMRGKLFFRLMLAACIPAYCLSLLWMNPPTWIFTIASAAAILLLGALILFYLLIRRSWVHWTLLQFQTKLLWRIAFIAFVIKLILQVLSVIPGLGRLAFGFRPVIIAYLHLVMLGFISFFLIGFFVQQKLFYATSWMWKKGLFIFITGVVLMELLLMIQSLLAINNSIWSFTPVLLFIIATILLGGVFLMFSAQMRFSKNDLMKFPGKNR
jgi:hypothetical protein